MLPWLKSAAIAATWPPSPICFGFVPPSVLLGAEPKLIVFASCVANSTFDCLNPVVPALEILSPRTLIHVSFRDRPFNDVLSADDRPMLTPPEVGCELKRLMTFFTYRPSAAQIRCFCC